MAFLATGPDGMACLVCAIDDPDHNSGNHRLVCPSRLPISDYGDNRRPLLTLCLASRGERPSFMVLYRWHVWDFYYRTHGPIWSILFYSWNKLSRHAIPASIRIYHREL